MKILSKVFHFKGGIHPCYRKELAAGEPVRELPVPAKLVLPMSQHLGAPAKPAVKVGDVVKKYQLVAEAGGFISAPVYAPAGGKVVELGVTQNASGARCASVVIETDPDAEAAPLAAIPDWRAAAPGDLLARVGEAGIVGMGGAGFPTKVKLSPPADKPIDTLILNGAECEPYLTSDHRVMLECARQIREGAEIIRRILGSPCVRIAIEDNKPDAIAAMEEACRDAEGDFAIVKLPTRYPQGSEKQQIFSVTGRQVPRGGLPMDTGCVVESVSTVNAVYEAVVKGIPLTRRVVTVTGDAVAAPGNFLVPFGTSYRTLIEAAGGFREPAAKVVSGGPMMGFTVTNLDVPTGKTTSGITCLTRHDVSFFTSQACISCGRCVEACPMRLIPSAMSQFIEADDIEGAKKADLMDCIECGSCAYVCPAHRPLVQHFRRAKGVIRAEMAAAKAKAAQSKG